MQISDHILITGLEFYGYHGATDAEQEVGHRYLVDVRLTVDTRLAAISDALTDTVDYGRVAQRIVQIGTETQFRLVEALIARLYEMIFAEFPQVEAIWLRVQKTRPPLNAIADSVGIEIFRTRCE